jgi:hypothetical protein
MAKKRRIYKSAHRWRSTHDARKLEAPPQVHLDVTGSFLAHGPPKFFREIIEIADDSSGSAQHGSRVKWPAASAYSSSERTASLSGGERPADALQRLALRRDAEARRD